MGIPIRVWFLGKGSIFFLVFSFSIIFLLFPISRSFVSLVFSYYLFGVSCLHIFSSFGGSSVLSSFFLVLFWDFFKFFHIFLSFTIFLDLHNHLLSPFFSNIIVPIFLIISLIENFSIFLKVKEQKVERKIRKLNKIERERSERKITKNTKILENEKS